MKFANYCDKCKYHDDGLCLRPTKSCAKEMRNAKIHGTINDILAVIAFILAVVALVLKLLLLL